MKYSVFTGMTPEYNLAEAAALFKRLGFDGVEWRVMDVPPEKQGEPPSFWGSHRCTIPLSQVEARAAEVRDLTEAAGLEIAALASYLRPADLAGAEAVMQGAAAMGCRLVRFWALPYDGTVPYRELFGKSLAGLVNIEALARAYDVRAVLEIHLGYIISSASLARRLVESFDPRYIGLIYDPGNMVYEGYEAWAMGIEILGPYLAHVHVKNAGWFPRPRDEDGTTRWEARTVPLPDGIVPWGEVLRLLRAAGYDGYLSLEDFSTQQPTAEKLAADLAYLQRLVAALA